MITLDQLDEILDERSQILFPGCQHPERNQLLNEMMMWIQKAKQHYSAGNHEPLGNFVLADILTFIRINLFSSILNFNWAKVDLLVARMMYRKRCQEIRGKGQFTDEVHWFFTKHLYLIWQKQVEAQQHKR